MPDKPWFLPNNTEELISPALLFYPDRIRHNIEQMIRISGDPKRLWPHIKTHKCEEIIRMQLEAGIDKFKCSTLPEAELLGRCGAKEALLAMQPTQVHLETFVRLVETYPKTAFSTLADNKDTLKNIVGQARISGQKIRLWMDVNSGMNRTGIPPGSDAVALYQKMNDTPWIEPMGLHVYDGHIHDPDVTARKERCLEAMRPVMKMRDEIHSKNLEIKKIIAGGSPSFAIHAQNEDFDLSPGTTLLWDARYGGNHPDLPFEPAAVLLTRVVSNPFPGKTCTDLGHKSVAAEMSFPRVHFLNLDPCEQVSQSEEHLVLDCPEGVEPPVGTDLYALPMHICPTVVKYEKAHIVVNNEISGTWPISARHHQTEFNT